MKKNVMTYVGIFFVSLVFGQSALANEKDVAVKGTNYEIVFKAEGGTFATKDGKEQKELTQRVQADKPLAEPKAPIKKDVEFSGWYTDQKLSKKWDFKKNVTSEMSLYAGWQAPEKKHLVKFNVAGANKIPDQSVKDNQTLTLPEAPTMEKFDFTGWYSDEMRTKAWDVKTKITSETTLYAMWTPKAEPRLKEFNVSFNSNGGSGITTQLVKENEVVIQPEAPVMEGFKFSGWFSDEELSQVWDFQTKVTADSVLYAKWEAVKPVVKEYNVTFNSNGGSEVTPQQVKENEVVVEPQVPTKKDFTFVGWFSDDTLTKKWDFQTKISAGTVLYAKWEAVKPVVKEYKVTFNSNGGSVIEPQKIKENEPIVPPKAPTKKNFTFAGWFSDAALTKKWDFQTKVTADTVLYAEWEAVKPVVKEYKVTFNSNGGSAIKAQQLKENELIVQPKAPTKKDVTFAGWFSDTTLTKKWDFQTKIKADTVLYAKWDAVKPVVKEFKVTFNSNGGSAVNAQQVKENDVVNRPQTPTKSGYTFTGWYGDEKLATSWNFKNKITRDTTLYAKWQVKVSPEKPRPTTPGRKTGTTTGRRNLPQTGETMSSIQTIIVGSVLVSATLVLVYRRFKVKKN